MNEDELRNIVEKLMNGEEISSKIVDVIVSELENPSEESDLHNLIRALALAREPTEYYISLIEKYFDPKLDDWTSKGVIYALCEYWGLTVNYINLLKPYIDEKNWDEYNSTSNLSISILSEYVYKNNDMNILNDFILLYEKHCINGINEDNKLYCSVIIQAIDDGINGPKLKLTGKKYKQKEIQYLLDIARKRVNKIYN